MDHSVRIPIFIYTPVFEYTATDDKTIIYLDGKIWYEVDRFLYEEDCKEIIYNLYFD
jgi:hypothetical protein